MPPRKRPTAFEVSFGSDDTSTPPIALRRDVVSDNSPFAKHPSSRSSSLSAPPPRQGASRNGPSAPNSASTSSRDAGARHGSAAREKRREGREERPSPRPEKRPKPTKTRHFDINSYECIKETRKTVIMGEDLDDLVGDDKPVRSLTHFVIFDPRKQELISLDEFYAGETHRQFEAFGTVTPVFANEEDAGQDDDYESGRRDRFVQRLRTSAIFNFMIDYSGDDSLYIQTEYAWYALKTPLHLYRDIWLDFYRPHRITQLAISQAIQLPEASWAKVKQKITKTRADDEVEEYFDRDEVENARSLILDALSTESVKENNQYRAAQSSKLYKDISEGRPWPSSATTAPPIVLRAPTISSKLFHNSDLDLAVLRPENQNRTTVTPLVLLLSDGLFRENLKVLGTAPQLPKEKNRYLKLLAALQNAQNVLKGPRNIVFPRDGRWKDEFYRSILLDGVEYKAGDYVTVPASAYPGRLQYEIPAIVDRDTVPKDRTLADYFWFARIIFFDQKTREMHVQWMEHSSKALTQEIHNPKELFLTDLCDNLPIEIISKIDVRRVGCLLDFPKYKDPDRENCDFHYSFSYNQKDGRFEGVNDVPSGFLQGDPPDNCPNCMRNALDEEGSFPQEIENGLCYRGVKYHINDFAMFKTNDEVCAVGQIIQFKFDERARARGACMVGVYLLGRISDIAHLNTGSRQVIKDERHFFTTMQIAQFDAEHLLRRCRVLNRTSLSEPAFTHYLDESPYHFFAEYAFPDTTVRNWHNVRSLTAKEPEICKYCHEEDSKLSEDRDDFRHRQGPQRAFDPFGGAGTFALAIQDAGCFKLTHAAEISPSAALTLKKNSPETVVYNQCSNVILEHAVKMRYPDAVVSKNVEIKNIGDGSPIPPPPRPEDIDCVVAGFPCQPHSRLNMFQKANDVKSHLMLNLLSWIEFLRPRFCFFENVRGFLQYGINGVQANRYKVQGGIAAGGLKFFVHAMVTMGYQVRFATLQSAHYGTPQTRVRFFLIAARLGEPLPSFPTPLYAFPAKDALEVKLPHGLVVHPIHIEPGIAPFRHITVDDAIGDLPRFDWANPRKPFQRPREDPETHKRVELAKCDKASGKLVCRPEGSKAGGYHYPPRTLYQAKARAQENSIRDLQHFTRVLKEDTVARVVLIPLEPRADYQSLFKDKDVPAELLEWQFADPKSAVARLGFRKGLYGRLDKDGYFQTTVTNVEPTAKQSWVLNPYCKRVVTVRELARSQGFPDHFRFYCYDTMNVKTIQREIGNAVPWPVGYALGLELRDALFATWLEARENAIVIDGSDD